MGDDSSQASSKSALSGSLLERIRAQRQAQQQSSTPAPSPLEPPLYTPEPASDNERWSLNVSWPHLLTPGTHSHEDTASQALLSTTGEQEYSMGGYLRTFLQDFYNLFRSMHPAAQVGIVVVLLYIAIKLI